YGASDMVGGAERAASVGEGGSSANHIDTNALLMLCVVSGPRQPLTLSATSLGISRIIAMGSEGGLVRKYHAEIFIRRAGLSELYESCSSIFSLTRVFIPEHAPL
ncbi:unnamed protein product, partial [Mycena citricolor]